MSITFDDVIDAIVDGSLDEHLDTITTAARDRRKNAASSLRYKLSTGDKVRIVGNLRPKYLVGLTGVVKRVNQTTISIDFDDRDAARRYAGGVRMPLEFVEKV